MLLIHAKVFDDVIAGTTNAWYSSVGFQESVGASDVFAIHACTTFVSGTGPTLTVLAEHSSDSQNWTQVGTLPEVNAVPIVNEGSHYGARNGFGRVAGAFLRFRVTLAGTSPACRLQLYVTGRVLAASAVPESPLFDQDQSP